MPLVSVLVTFYNQKEYIERTLSSILNQKRLFDLEIIVGDDGSNDGTLEELETWKNKYPSIIQIVVMNRDDGITLNGFRASRNRLTLLKYVTGKYFIFLDGDDFFSDSGKLQRQVEILENSDNQDCVACSHYIDALYPDGHRIRLPQMDISEGKVSLKKYWPGWYFHTDTTLARSSVIESIPKEYVLNHYNDNLITFLILECGNIYFLPERMAVYTQTGDGIWTSQKTIQNHIRNLYAFDICNKIDPGIRRETEMRFAKSWEYLFTHKKDLVKEDTDEYLAEAEKKQLKYSVLFTNYARLTLTEKKMLFFRMISVFINHCVFKIKRTWESLPIKHIKDQI